MDDEKQPNITIIKRKRRKEDAHHGGVWKIAYADFMTAMMAFFLVMWLINASNEETRAQVASYFNPVNLVDSTAQPRGLNEKEDDQKSTNHTGKKVPAKEKAESEHKKKSEKETHGETESAKKEKKKEKHSKPGGEAELFRSPIDTLDKIAGGPRPNMADVGHGKKSGTNKGNLKEHKYRDPFAPNNWQVVKVEPAKPVSKSTKEKQQTTLPPSLAKLLVDKLKDKTEKEKTGHEDKTLKKTTSGSEIKIAKLEHQPEKKSAEKQAKKLAPKDDKKEEKYSQVKAAIAKATSGKSLSQRPQVDVTKTKKGVLLSLSDDAEFGMFSVASAKPAKELVLFMEKISKVLLKQSGKIVIKGHTDGRPFHSKDYDNWRLSSARAQIARYMLIRGGTDEKRFLRIEGHADRDLKVPDHPYDARNRRIEILLLD